MRLGALVRKLDSAIQWTVPDFFNLSLKRQKICETVILPIQTYVKPLTYNNQI